MDASAPTDQHPLLFVEDNSQFRKETTRKYLKRYMVVECGDGQEFLDVLHSQDFRIILMDYELPDTTGEALTEKARESGYDGAIVGISSSEYLNRKMERAGADLSLVKRERYLLPGVLQQALAIAQYREEKR